MKYNEFKQNILYSFASMKEFADHIGYSPSSLSNIKQKDEVPDYLALISILMAELKHKGGDPKEVLKNFEPTKKETPNRIKKFNGTTKYSNSSK